jgi:hypothetical protein
VRARAPNSRDTIPKAKTQRAKRRADMGRAWSACKAVSARCRTLPSTFSTTGEMNLFDAAAGAFACFKLDVHQVICHSCQYSCTALSIHTRLLSEAGHGSNRVRHCEATTNRKRLVFRPSMSPMRPSHCAVRGSLPRDGALSLRSRGSVRYRLSPMQGELASIPRRRGEGLLPHER